MLDEPYLLYALIIACELGFWVDQPEHQRLGTLRARGSLSMLHLAGKAPIRRRPVNSALGITGDPMRAPVALLFASVFLASSACASSDAQVSAADPRIRFAEKAAVDALNFRQSELASLVDTKPIFTAPGWADFMKRLTGFVDPQGAATFTSTFTPSGAAIAAKQDKASLTITVPGVLKHESRTPQGAVSTTSYRAEIDLRVSPSPFKVEMLVQRTCGGAATKPSCR